MYVSRAVESIRDDPVPDATVELTLETSSEADIDTVAEDAEAVGATVKRRLPFDDLEVSIAQEDVDDLCEIDGVTAILTSDSISTHPDEIEEDVDLDDLDDGA